MKKPSTVMSDRILEMVEYRMDGMTFREIAEKFSITTAGASTQIKRGLRMLRYRGEAALPDNTGIRYTASELVTFAQKEDHNLPDGEREYRIKITQIREGYVTVRAEGGPTAARAKAIELYETQGKELPDMEDSACLRFSVVGIIK